jgi:hypothetical protein
LNQDEPFKIGTDPLSGKSILCKRIIIESNL